MRGHFRFSHDVRDFTPRVSRPRAAARTQPHDADAVATKQPQDVAAEPRTAAIQQPTHVDRSATSLEMAQPFNRAGDGPAGGPFDIRTTNPYQVLQLDVSSYEQAMRLTEQDVLTAYRRRALALHPDKNKDDPHAADRFVTLQNSRDALLDWNM